MLDHLGSEGYGVGSSWIGRGSEGYGVVLSVGDGICVSRERKSESEF